MSLCSVQGVIALFLDQTRLESLGVINRIPFRRSFYQYDPRELSSILGVPSEPSHLPEAEPVLPGHTLLRPALGMLKSSVKYPHVDLEGGAGVYGNMDNLGIRYDGRNERVLYSGFRRTPAAYIMEGNEKVHNLITEIIKQLKIPELKGLYHKPSAIHLEDLNKVIYVIMINLDNNMKVEVDSKKSNQHPVSYPFYKEQHRDGYKKGRLKNILRQNPIDADFYDDDDPKEEKKEDKKTWFWKTKDAYNHIKINQNAPDLSELLPDTQISEKLRKWWFYNQDDFEPFSGEN